MRILFVVLALIACTAAMAQSTSAPASQPALSKAERIFIERGTT